MKMVMGGWRGWVLGVAAALALHGPAAAAEVRVMISNALAAAYDQLVPAFERKTGHRIVTAYGPSMGATPQAIPNRLARGEPVDVVIMAGDAVDGLVAKGYIATGSRTDLARSRIGMVVRAGAPKPDISTDAALKQTLLKATSIAYSDSASGVYVGTELFARLGVADAVRAKARMIPATPVARIVAQGEAEIGFQQISELLPVPGADFVGPLPDDLQKVTVFAAGVGAKAAEPAAGRALIAFLRSAEAAPVLTKSGLDPMPGR